VRADTGIGIPASDLPQLFSRFHRASNAIAYPGGLGLAIVGAIVAVTAASDGRKHNVRCAFFALALVRTISCSPRARDRPKPSTAHWRMGADLPSQALYSFVLSRKLLYTFLAV
jgi:hypothetical protein